MLELTLLGAFVAAVLGFGWLALAMAVHWQQVQGNCPLSRSNQLALRLLGSMALLLSGLLCGLADRPSMAVLVWLMFLATAAPVVALSLAWYPQRLRWLWPWRQ